MLMICLKAARSVSVMLLASPQKAKQLVSRMKGQRMRRGTTRACWVDVSVAPVSVAPVEESSEAVAMTFMCDRSR